MCLHFTAINLNSNTKYFVSEGDKLVLKIIFFCAVSELPSKTSKTIFFDKLKCLKVNMENLSCTPINEMHCTNCNLQ